MPALLVVSGPPGSGKSTLSDRLAALRPVVRISVDDVEDAMRACGLAEQDTGVAAYEVVRAAAQQNLLVGRDVVVDAVNDSAPARDTWVRAARAARADLLLAVLDPPPPDVHRARLESRRRPYAFLPEPTWTHVRAVSDGAAPWPEEVLRLDAARPVEELVGRLLDLLGSSGRSRGRG